MAAIFCDDKILQEEILKRDLKLKQHNYNKNSAILNRNIMIKTFLVLF